MVADYQLWWDEKGSGYRPKENEDTEEFIYRICAISWLNGEMTGAKEEREEMDEEREA